MHDGKSNASVPVAVVCLGEEMEMGDLRVGKRREQNSSCGLRDFYSECEYTARMCKVKIAKL